MDLATAADVAQILGVLTIVGGGGVALVQFRHARQDRRDKGALELMHTWQDLHYRQSVRRIMALPDDADPAAIEADPELAAAVDDTDFIMETWGLAVYERMVDLHMMDRFCGGTIRLTWRKLHRVIEHRRAQLGGPFYGDWFQWLVERMEEDPAPGKADGAHVAFKVWRR